MSGRRRHRTESGGAEPPVVATSTNSSSSSSGGAGVGAGRGRGRKRNESASAAPTTPPVTVSVAAAAAVAAVAVAVPAVDTEPSVDAESSPTPPFVTAAASPVAEKPAGTSETTAPSAVELTATRTAMDVDSATPEVLPTGPDPHHHHHHLPVAIVGDDGLLTLSSPHHLAHQHQQQATSSNSESMQIDSTASAPVLPWEDPLLAVTGTMSVLAAPPARRSEMRWRSSDDYNLIVCVEQMHDFEAVAKSVKFSRPYTVEEIKSRWHTLLYDDRESAAALSSIFSTYVRGMSFTTLNPVPWSRQEDETLRAVPHGGDESVFQELHTLGGSQFHASRTPKSLRRRWNALRYHNMLFKFSDTPMESESSHGHSSTAQGTPGIQQQLHHQAEQDVASVEASVAEQEAKPQSVEKNPNPVVPPQPQEQHQQDLHRHQQEPELAQKPVQLQRDPSQVTLQSPSAFEDGIPNDPTRKAEIAREMEGLMAAVTTETEDVHELAARVHHETETIVPSLSMDHTVDIVMGGDDMRESMVSLAMTANDARLYEDVSFSLSNATGINPPAASWVRAAVSASKAHLLNLNPKRPRMNITVPPLEKFNAFEESLEQLGRRLYENVDIEVNSALRAELERVARTNRKRMRELEQELLWSYPKKLASGRTSVPVSKSTSRTETSFGMDARSLALLRCVDGELPDYQMRFQQILIGRSTDNSKADVDLKQHAYGHLVSRLQAILKFKSSGSFRLQNLGRRPIFVNGVQVTKNESRTLPSSCLLEIGHVKLLFHANLKLLRELYAETVAVVREGSTSRQKSESGNRSQR